MRTSGRTTQVDLVGVVRQVVDGLQMLARERGVEVTIAAPEHADRASGDRDELMRVFENLIENALKYGGSGKRVEIDVDAAGAGGGEAKVAVRDYGPGIAPEHLPRLTERFYRVDVGHSRAEGGTGLGLALVKHILNRHRGRLTIDSIVGQWARTLRCICRCPQRRLARRSESRLVNVSHLRLSSKCHAGVIEGMMQSGRASRPR